MPRLLRRSLPSLVSILIACGGTPPLPADGGGGGGGGGGATPPGDTPPGGQPDPGGAPKELPAPAWPPLQAGVERVGLAYAPDVAATILDLSNEAYQPGTARYHGTWQPVGLRLRGDGSRFHPKLSWKARLPDGVLVDGQRTRNFIAEYLDGGYLSDPFSYGLMLGAGVRSPRARFVTLDVNGAAQGVYVDVQQVDKHFLRERGFDENANIYRCGARDCEMTLWPKESYQYPWEKHTNEREPWDDLWQFLRELNRTPEHELAAWLERNLDLDAFVRFYAVAILVSYSGVDDSGSYLVHDGVTGKWTFVPWDLNNSRLVFWRGNELAWGAEVWYPIPTYTLYDPGTIRVAADKSQRYAVDAHPPYVVLFQRAWDLPALRDRILDEVEAMLGGVFAADAAFARVDALAALIRDELPRDPWVDPVQAADAPAYLKRYVEGRRAFLAKQIPLERRRGEGGLVVNALRAGSVELLNREDAPRSLAGLALTSDLRRRTQTPLPDVTVAAHGKVTIPFPIDDAGGEVGLFDVATLMPLDVAFYAPLAGRTYARTPDGAEAWGWR